VPADPPLRQEIAEGIRRPRFRNAVLGQLVMLAGVFVLHWSALEIAVFLLVEATLFMSLRAAAEITIESGFTTSPARFAWEFAKHWLVAFVFIGLMIGIFGAFAVIPAFGDDATAAFREDGSRRASLVVALAVMTGSLIVDTALFARRVAAGRGATEQAEDVQSVRMALATVVFLAMGSFLLGIAGRLGLGPQALAIAIAVSRLYVEAVPRRAAALFAPPAPAERP
jgi:hypothetical protein